MFSATISIECSRSIWPCVLIPGISSRVAMDCARSGGRGKQGGTRIIYFFDPRKMIILMVFAFKKNERSDLSKDQLKELAAVAAQELT